MLTVSERAELAIYYDTSDGKAKKSRQHGLTLSLSDLGTCLLLSRLHRTTVSYIADQMLDAMDDMVATNGGPYDRVPTGVNPFAE